MKPMVSGAAAVLAILASLACSRLPQYRELDPESREFFSKVRYIITSEERAAFLKIGPDERPQFIKDFWLRRDPTPGSEINEYKEGYFRRIAEANKLFREGSTPGWLQDRGRVYLTLGPPDNREAYPRGVTFYGKPEEIWWYGNFPIVFVDDNWSGNYQMVAMSAQTVAEIARAQRDERERGAGKTSGAAPSVNFEVSAEKAEGRAVFVLRVPYKAIWFKAEGDRFETTLEASLAVSDPDGRKVWETRKSFDLSVSRAELVRIFDGTYDMRIEAGIAAGSYTLDASVSNKTGGSRSRKSLDFEI